MRPSLNGHEKHTFNMIKYAFDPKYQDKLSGDMKPEPSLASVPQEPPTICNKKKNKLKHNKQKITPAITRVTQDKHPSKYRRMPFLA